jgi:predicted kinase
LPCPDLVGAAATTPSGVGDDVGMDELRRTLVVTRGLPGSGKTTRARAWVAADPGRRARVNRDDLRAMLHAGAWLGADTEDQIVRVRDAAVSALLRHGTDVVCDDTNLPRRALRQLTALAAGCGARLELWDLTGVPVPLCVARDAAREHPIGEAVIRELHRRYLADPGTGGP